MSGLVYGGVEGGGTHSTTMIFNDKGEKLAQVEGPSTNLYQVKHSKDDKVLIGSYKDWIGRDKQTYPRHGRGVSGTGGAGGGNYARGAGDESERVRAGGDEQVADGEHGDAVPRPVASLRRLQRHGGHAQHGHGRGWYRPDRRDREQRSARQPGR